MAIRHAWELDGELIRHGRRLLQLNAVELLNFTYAWLVEKLDREQREELDDMLRPEPETVKSLLPERLRHMTPPPGWRAVADPWTGR